MTTACSTWPKIYLQRVMQALRPQLLAGVPIVVLEPSCASVFRDELPNLFPDDPLAQKLKQQTLLLSEFLEQKAGNRSASATQAQSAGAGPLPSQVRAQV